MPKSRSPILQNALLNISIFMGRVREPILVSIKKSIKLRKLKKSLRHYNSYGYIQERQFSPSSTPLIRFHRRMSLNKRNRDSHSIFLHCTCFGGIRADDEMYPLELGAKPLSAIEDLGVAFSRDDYSCEEDSDSVDVRAERFIEKFCEEMRRQRKESSLQLNRMLEY